MSDPSIPAPAPTRDLPYRGHRCRCLLLPQDRCGQWVEVPDQPVCDDCERVHRHRPDFRVVVPGGGHARP